MHGAYVHLLRYKLFALVAESQENDSAGSVDWSDYVYGIEAIYDKVKSILEDAQCLSRRQHNTADDILSRTGPRSPMCLHC